MCFCTMVLGAYKLVLFDPPAGHCVTVLGISYTCQKNYHETDAAGQKWLQLEPCRHWLCGECGDAWMQRHAKHTCPVCRSRIVLTAVVCELRVQWRVCSITQTDVNATRNSYTHPLFLGSDACTACEHHRVCIALCMITSSVALSTAAVPSSALLASGLPVRCGLRRAHACYSCCVLCGSSA